MVLLGINELENNEINQVKKKKNKKISSNKIKVNIEKEKENLRKFLQNIFNDNGAVNTIINKSNKDFYGKYLKDKKYDFLRENTFYEMFSTTAKLKQSANKLQKQIQINKIEELEKERSEIITKMFEIIREI